VGLVNHTLIVVRHAKSDWSGGEPDDQRPLAKRGRKQAPEAGAWIAANHPQIDLAVVSPASRARQTWELVAKELGEVPPVRIDDRVYGGYGSALRTVVTELPDDVRTAVLVGHNPGVEDLVEELTQVWVALPTSAIAVVEVVGSWADAKTGSARIVTTGRPPTN
jgi:phosphohistidine phosphatase